MMRFWLLVYLLMSCVSVQAALFGNESNIKGDCNVVVQDSNGVTVNPTCINLPEKAVQALESYLNEFLGDAKQHQRELKRYDKLMSLQESEISQLHQQIEEWVKRFHNLKKELSSIEAIGQISQELLDEALLALDSGDLDKAGQLLDELIAQLDEEEFEQEQQQRAKIYYSRALVHEQQYELLKALPLYQKAYRYAPDNIEYAGNYAKLLQEQNQFKPAARIYETILDELQILASEDDAYLGELATTQNNLGTLYAQTTRYELAEQHFKAALDTYEQLAKPQAFLPDVATTQNNLGNLYSDTTRYELAKQHFKQALDTRQQLAKINPQAFLPDVANTQNNLGNLYKNITRYELAEQYYKKALETRQKLAKQNPQAFLPDVAMTQNNLGILYKSTTRYELAEQHFKEALDTYEQLAKINPQAFLSYVAQTQNNLGTLYAQTTRYELAEQHFKEALETYEQLAKINPQAFNDEVADTLGKLAVFYFEQEKSTQAVEYAQQAIDLYRPLAKSYPQVYGDRFAASVGLMLAERQIPNDLCAVLADVIETVQNKEWKQFFVEKNNELCTEN
ncbi:tetratricopeptide repeat protein [Candidatus Albibeggiatoa sp. nov. NOAA]|uniref:tetratricopeptide repeat protein n=1 Tax=Candidatus Albibeggiatoa sp. nov. NOAA TaxID=3162724 RepID=UPI00330344F8|nr:tetratricopeptide repeat protein [Thiotrichaceae bacterium]